MATSYYNLIAELGITEDDKNVVDLNEKLKGWSKLSTLKRGDILILDTEEERYRNDGVYIWDGQEALELDDILDEYGALPRSFQVSDTEFNPHYWVNAIGHNGFFWLTPEILKRMSFTKQEDGTISSSVRIGDKTWTCIVDYPEELPEEYLKNLSMLHTYIGKTLLLETCESEYIGEFDYNSTFFLKYKEPKSKMLTEDGLMQTVTLSKETLETLIHTTLSEKEWYTFADSTGMWCGCGDGKDKTHTIIDVCFPSFEELESFLKNYNVVLTDEMWYTLEKKDEEE